MNLNIVMFLGIVILPVVGVWFGYRLAEANQYQQRLIAMFDCDVRGGAVCDEADMCLLAVRFR